MRRPIAQIRGCSSDSPKEAYVILSNFYANKNVIRRVLSCGFCLFFGQVDEKIDIVWFWVKMLKLQTQNLTATTVTHGINVLASALARAASLKYMHIIIAAARCNCFRRYHSNQYLQRMSQIRFDQTAYQGVKFLEFQGLPRLQLLKHLETDASAT